MVPHAPVASAIWSLHLLDGLREIPLNACRDPHGGVHHQRLGSLPCYVIFIGLVDVDPELA